MKTQKRWLCVLALLLLAAGCAGTEEEKTTQETFALSDFSADTLSGGSFTPAELQAKDVTIVNFWSLLCAPCIQEMPDLAAFEKNLPENVRLVTVCLDGAGSEEAVTEILQTAAYQGVTLLRGEGDYETLCRSIRYTPTTLFLDAQGKLVGKTLIGTQNDLAKTYLSVVNQVLKDQGKTEITLSSAESR